jgi:hypothetical protein
MTDTHGLDSQYKELTGAEFEALRAAHYEIYVECQRNAYKRPKMTTLLEEFSELVLSFRGKHDDPPELELTQIAAAATNMLWQIKMGYDVNNIVSIKDK